MTSQASLFCEIFKSTRSRGRLRKFTWEIDRSAHQQENGFDCGVHTMLHVREIATGEPVCYTEAWKMRSQILVELLLGQLCTHPQQTVEDGVLVI